MKWKYFKGIPFVRRIFKWVQTIFQREKKQKYTMLKGDQTAKPEPVLHGARFRPKGKTKGAFGKPRWMRASFY